MGDWTYPYPDVDPPDAQESLRNQDWRPIEVRRVRARQVGASRVAELEQTQAVDAIGEPHTVADVPLPFEAPARTSLTY